jgi:hypothetical protein
MTVHEIKEERISALLGELVAHIRAHDVTTGMLSTSNLAQRQANDIREKLANLVRYANARG